jgi:hypothetical protein
LKHIWTIKLRKTPIHENYFIHLCKIEYGSYQHMKAKVLDEGISDHLQSSQFGQNYKLQITLNILCKRGETRREIQGESIC